MKYFKEGQILSCKVSSLKDFGLLLKCEGQDVFVKIVDITWDDGPLDEKPYQQGSVFDVKILKKFSEKQMGCYYLGSIKEASPLHNPWVSHEYRPGDKHDGIVVSIADYGIIVRLETGALGLIRYPPKIEDISINQYIKVKIIDVDKGKKRLLLDFHEGK